MTQTERVDALKLESIQLGSLTSIADAVRNVAATSPQRIVVAVSERLELTANVFNECREAAGEVPFGWATGSYFDGARRTGIGSLGGFIQPWYRWWDGWRDWLAGTSQAGLSALAGSTDHLLESKLDANPNILSNGWIVADCQTTGHGWRCACDNSQASVEQPSAAVQLLSGVAFEHATTAVKEARLAAPDWILLDDSVQSIRQGSSAELHERLARIRDDFSQTLIIIATSLPRAEDWIAMQRIPACEFIAKPSTGSSLRACLGNSLNSKPSATPVDQATGATRTNSEIGK